LNPRHETNTGETQIGFLSSAENALCPLRGSPVIPESNHGWDKFACSPRPQMILQLGWGAGWGVQPRPSFLWLHRVRTFLIQLVLPWSRTPAPGCDYAAGPDGCPPPPSSKPTHHAGRTFWFLGNSVTRPGVARVLDTLLSPKKRCETLTEHLIPHQARKVVSGFKPVPIFLSNG